MTTQTLISRLPKRELIVGAIVVAAILAVVAAQGLPFGMRMLVEASCYAILALGLTIQWGYAGQLNAGVLGFLALGGFASMLFSVPMNAAFWNTDLPLRLGGAMLWTLLGIAVVVASANMHRLGVSRKVRTWVSIVVAFIVYMALKMYFVPIAAAIEDEAQFIGGLGMHPLVGWLMGGALAGLVGYFIGKICLGLRSDYLVIATLGIAEIIKAALVNEDWLTRGTATVSPIPWPVPGPSEVGFLMSRSLFFIFTGVLVIGIFLLLQRAYNAPWGRMIRSIRDNEISSAAMGKNINRRRLEIFVFGCILMGVGGAALTNFTGIFNAQGYMPLNHTFLILVMVILGGPGNNLGTILGAFLVYIIWVMSEPMALAVMQLIIYLGDAWFQWEPPGNIASRALQSRVFVIGLLISLLLRYAPQGLMPERIKHDV
ncbi:MAG: branched-chain amino acid ABC transporter permease [Natronospirillum sp.]